MNQHRKKDFIMFLGIVIIGFFCVWKAQYGLGGKDVSLYITNPYRFVNGDIMFWDEWNATQLSSFFFIPVVKIYKLIVGSTESIMLYSRYLYIIVNSICAIIIYLRLKRFGNITIIIVWIFALFSPFNHSMLSYNSMGMMFGFVGLVILVTTKGKRDYFFAGLCYSIATLCQPILAIIFIIFSFIFITYSIIKKQIDYIKNWVIFSVACLVVSIPLIAYVLLVTRVKRFLSFLYCWAHQSSQEPANNRGLIQFVRWIINPFLPKRDYHAFGISINSAFIIAGLYLTLLIIVCICLISILKKNSKTSKVCIICGCVVSMLISALCAVTSIYTNAINVIWFPWLFVGLMCYKFTNNQLVNRVFKYSVIWGVIHTIGYLNSNGGGIVFAVAWFPASILSLLLVYNSKIIKTPNLKRIICICVLISTISLAFARANGMFYDQNIFSLNKKINEGPAKGIRVNKKTYYNYKAAFADIKSIDMKNKNVLLLTEKVWSYLFMNQPLAQNSTYLMGINNSTLNDLKTYYDINKKKSVDIIYIPKDEIGEIDTKDITDTLKIKKYKITDSKNSFIINVLKDK